MAERAQSLNRLRSWRVRPERDVTITKQVRALVHEAAANQKQFAGASAAWEAIAPAGLRRVCEARSAASGVLTIKAAGAPARFQLDRWLKSGGEAALFAAGVKRVKVV